MNEIAYSRLAELAAKPESRERSVRYIEKHICAFLKQRDRVLICFDNDPGSICNMMVQAVQRCGAIPVVPRDMRWKTLLREAFSSRCACIVGTPLLVLGLSKLAARMDIPLFVRNVVLAGYPTADWMIDGIRRGLDCKIWGLYDPGAGLVVAGFSCDGSGSVHLRSEEYGVNVVDSDGAECPDGKEGEVVLYPVENPQLRFRTGDSARITMEPCSCGCTSPRLLDFDPLRGVDSDLFDLGANLQLWTSVLDCRLAKTGYGLEMEIVTFPGEKLPVLPSCAKLVIRNWDPETDKPFPHMFVLKNRFFSRDYS